MPRTDDDLAFVSDGIKADLHTLALYNVLRTYSYLAPLVDAGLRQQQLTSAQLNALLVLRAAGEEGLLMGQLGERLVVTKSNVTGLVDRLEAQGLVRRVQPRDRRATSVHLTAEGLALLERAAPAHAQQLSELAEALTDSEKQQLIELLTKLRRALRLRQRGEK